jgi:hypothetical protein
MRSGRAFRVQMSVPRPFFVKMIIQTGMGWIPIGEFRLSIPAGVVIAYSLEFWTTPYSDAASRVPSSTNFVGGGRFKNHGVIFGVGSLA